MVRSLGFWHVPKYTKKEEAGGSLSKKQAIGKATGRLCTGCGAILDVEWVRLSYNLKQSWGDAGRKRRINPELAIHTPSGYLRFRRLEYSDLHVFCRFLMKSSDPEGAGHWVGFVAAAAADRPVKCSPFN